MMKSLRSLFSAWSADHDLRSLDDRRLSDLGLDRYDLMHARGVSSAKRGSFFESRRGARAASWLR